MKTIITAKANAAGTSISDIQQPLQVTEIATELIITRLALISMLQEGMVTKDDIIVTNADRKCLYTNIFKNVICWNEWESNSQLYDGHVIDLLDPTEFNKMAAGPVGSRTIPYLPFYRNWERDKEYICNFEKGNISDYKTDNDFVCLVIRTRQAWPEKNLPKDYWDSVISEFVKNGVNVFIFGKETEVYEGHNVKHVNTFQNWCTLVEHANCKAVISTITGGVYPALIFGNKDITLTIIDNTDQVKIYGYDPSWYNDCINFSGIKKRIIVEIPTPQELYENFLNDCK